MRRNTARERRAPQSPSSLSMRSASALAAATQRVNKYADCAGARRSVSAAQAGRATRAAAASCVAASAASAPGTKHAPRSPGTHQRKAREDEDAQDRRVQHRVLGQHAEDGVACGELVDGARLRRGTRSAARSAGVGLAPCARGAHRSDGTNDRHQQVHPEWQVLRRAGLQLALALAANPGRLVIQRWRSLVRLGRRIAGLVGAHGGDNAASAARQQRRSGAGERGGPQSKRGAGGSVRARAGHAGPCRHTQTRGHHGVQHGGCCGSRSAAAVEQRGVTWRKRKCGASSRAPLRRVRRRCAAPVARARIFYARTAAAAAPTAVPPPPRLLRQPPPRQMAAFTAFQACASRGTLRSWRRRLSPGA